MERQKWKKAIKRERSSETWGQTKRIQRGFERKRQKMTHRVGAGYIE
jgi:hypothetical protein